MSNNVLGMFLFAVALNLSVQTRLVAQQWTPRGPAPRWLHTAVFDPNTKRMIVFGGSPDQSVTQGSLNDVFWLTNASVTGRSVSWEPVNASGVRPAPREGHTAVYDSTNSRMIVFGGGLGRTSPCVNDVWVLTNANGAAGSPAWLRVSPSGQQPAARLQSNAVYDPNSNRLIVFGGNNCFPGSAFNDVWTLSNANGLGGASVWTQLTPSGTPPLGRYAATAVYDPANNVMVVFGGETVTGTLTQDLWVLANANGLGGPPTWTQLVPSLSPPARAGHSATYDAANNRMIIFGGGTSAGLVSDVWVLSNATGIGGTPSWSQLMPSGSVPPAPRANHTAVYDPVANVMTIFGGFIDSVQIPVNDTFIISQANGL